ncbi:MAG: Uma2 family endonuclease [Pseudonocardia sp.]
MSAHPALHRWTLAEFLHAWEAGSFGKRIELIDGEVWDVPIGPWHARTTARIIRALPNDRFEVLAGSLPAGESLPEPDCWVLRIGAEPVAHLSRRMLRWAADDVMLVVEVSDETRDHDLGRKATLYAQSGYRWYWVVAREGVYCHTGPSTAGYDHRVLYKPGERVPVPYVDGVTLAVDDLLAPQ